MVWFTRVNPDPKIVTVNLVSHTPSISELFVPDHSIPTLERLIDSDSEEKLGWLCGMAGKYHRNK